MSGVANMDDLKAGLACLGLLGASAVFGCDLQIESPWIREAPPTSTALAAYATLKNGGSHALQIVAISAAAAGMAMLHETTVTGGMARMRAVESLRIPAGGVIVLAPGGKHLMLMDLKGLPRTGEQLTISFKDTADCVTSADFVIRRVRSEPLEPNR